MLNHPDHLARLIRLRSTWREPGERGTRDHQAVDWKDACMALAGASPLAYAAFTFRFSEEPPTRELIVHLLAVATRELGRAPTITPEQLVEVVLREERAPANQRNAAIRACFLGLSAGQWRALQRPHAVVGSEIDKLVSDAWCAIRLASNEEEAEAA
jgi:hypothetical protein